MNNPIVLGMRGPRFLTLGFASDPIPDSDLFIDPKYAEAGCRTFANAEGCRTWGNDEC